MKNFLKISRVHQLIEDMKNEGRMIEFTTEESKKIDDSITQEISRERKIYDEKNMNSTRIIDEFESKYPLT